MLVDPTSRFLYAADSTTTKLNEYAITVSTGALTPLNGSPFTVDCDGGSAMAVEPTGRYLCASSGPAPIPGFFVTSNTGVLTDVGTFTPAAAIDAPAADPLSQYGWGPTGETKHAVHRQKFRWRARS